VGVAKASSGGEWETRCAGVVSLLGAGGAAGQDGSMRVGVGYKVVEPLVLLVRRWPRVGKGRSGFGTGTPVRMCGEVWDGWLGGGCGVSGLMQRITGGCRF